MTRAGSDELEEAQAHQAGITFGWCPSIAWMKGLRSVVDRLLIEPVAKVWGHTIAQQLLHGPHMVRQTCCHSRRDWLPLLG